MSNNKKKRKLRKIQRELEAKRMHSLTSKVSVYFSKNRIVLYILIGVPLCFLLRNLHEESLIKGTNVQAKGYIYSVRNNGHNNMWYYYFYVDGKKYTGLSYSYDNLKIGNSIDVVYYPNNPKINRSKEDLFE